MTEGLSRDFDEPLDPKRFDKFISSLSEEQQSAFWRLYSAKQNYLTADEAQERRLLIELFRQATKDIEVHVARIFSEQGTDKWDLQTMRRFGRDKALFEQIKQRIQTLNADLNQRVEQAMTNHFKKAWFRNAHKLDSLTPASTSIQFGIIPDYNILALLHRPFGGAMFSDRIGLITDEMAENIRRELLRSMISGESWNQAARRIRDEMGTRGRKAVWRAEMVARTELTRAQEMGTFQFNEENKDVIDKVVWVAHSGACEDCRALDGKVLKKEDDYPPNPSHPNCTCDAMAIPKPWNKLATPDEEKDKPVVQPFNNWMEDKVGGTI